MPVVAARELDDSAPPGGSPRHPQCGHRRLGAGRHETHHLATRNALGDAPGELHLGLCRQSEQETAPRRSLWRTATFETLRRTFLKIAVRIEELNTRIKIALPSAYPYRTAMISMAGCIAAQGP